MNARFLLVQYLEHRYYLWKNSTLIAEVIIDQQDPYNKHEILFREYLNVHDLKKAIECIEDHISRMD